MADYNGSEEYIASQDQEVASTGKKYGGLVPKKKPLISKDHERAFFDSADWALCKSSRLKTSAGVKKLIWLKSTWSFPKICRRTPIATQNHLLFVESQNTHIQL
ncbi:uncharacterized protein LOC132293452 isoform X2 [Cornus florida]|uniref:uncharacterized protein LOC132293452 isoform X2 n=1 Tax=Cornus florida TaxID=4283 RepID=UPI00289CCAF0|nr:uncharacterized protein LOC132293452 isoform X2 [Cornus florida]